MSNSEAGAIMRYSFLVALANDHVVDSDELGMIKRLALRDGIVDAAEREVLSRLFARFMKLNLSPEVRREILDFKAEHSIP